METRKDTKIRPKYKVGDTVFYNSFGKIKEMLIETVTDIGDGDPMYEDKEGSAVFESDLL